jgi:hypothetical protein
MRIEIRLKKVLADHKLDNYGIVRRMSKDLELHRHTIRKLYNNLHKNPSLEMLGQVCDWLIKNKVPVAELPAALFGVGPGSLWEAVVEPGTVITCLGEYQQFHGNTQIAWIARRDAAAAAKIVQLLSMPRVAGKLPPSFDTKYIPFLVSDERIGKELKQDHSAAIKMYRQMQTELNRASAVLIGSQRINELVEIFAADLFGCKPFVASRGVRVPFYLAFQSKLRPVESCFGGLINPPGRNGKFVKGTHYLTSEGKWSCIPWIEGKQDSGIVITRSEAGKGLLLAISGLSGRASEALGHYLTGNAAPFWPTCGKKGGQKIGVYICKITYLPNTSNEQEISKQIKDVEVMPMDEAILTKYLNARKKLKASV